MSKTFTWADVADHNSRKSTWLVVENEVFDCTKFLEEHPGGEEVIMENAGFDATDAFDEIGHSDDAKDLLKSMKIGTLVDSAKPPSKSSRVAETTSIRAVGSKEAGGSTNWIAVAAIPVIAAVAYFAFAK
ncbi:hypothetical protein HDU77_002593 [Chytriomyces hyalinus]|nr:hypothetical protein HDU77_002593 [Chytriomyces hyalinus]KAJ3408744.1 hypothetical protein HDU80_004689 [Chytriomyces hyalinus]